MEPRNDQRLEAAIRAIGAWRGLDVGITPVSVGRDERHLLIEAHGELFMLRLAAPTSERPGLEATAELEVLAAASSAGVAPEIVAALPQLGCLVTRFAPGRHLTPGDFERDDVLASVVGSLRALHACPSPASLRSVFQEARDLRRAALSGGISMPPAEAAASEAVLRIEQDHAPDAQRLVSCHGDLTPASLLLARDHTWIVDFRWAGAGDTFEDLGSIAAHLDLREERADALLAMYFGSIPEGSRERLRALRAAADYLAAMRELTRPSTDPRQVRREAEGRLRDVVVAVDALPGWRGPPREG